jgi:hypothetical protein
MCDLQRKCITPQAFIKEENWPQDGQQQDAGEFIRHLLNAIHSKKADCLASCFIAHEFDRSRVQTPGADTVNQAVHPSGVGKLVAVSMQWVTAVEDCEGKRAAVRWLACGLCSRMAQTTTRRFPAVSTGALVAA